MIYCITRNIGLNQLYRELNQTFFESWFNHRKISGFGVYFSFSAFIYIIFSNFIFIQNTKLHLENVSRNFFFFFLESGSVKNEAITTEKVCFSKISSTFKSVYKVWLNFIFSLKKTLIAILLLKNTFLCFDTLWFHKTTFFRY